MELQYWTITSVWKSTTYGAQICTIKAHMSNKEYQNAEIISPKGMNYLPITGDLVVFAEIHNSEIIVLWVLEQTDLSISGWDIVIHRGVKTKQGSKNGYNMKSRITLWKDFSITLETWDGTASNFTSTASMKILPNGNIQVKCNSFEIL